VEKDRMKAGNRSKRSPFSFSDNGQRAKAAVLMRSEAGSNCTTIRQTYSDVRGPSVV